MVIILFGTIIILVGFILAETDNTASLKLAKRYGFVEFATTEDTDGGTTIHLIRKAGGR